MTSDQYQPQFPIYIISKGRWKTRHTSKALDLMGVPYRIAVEPQEYDLYVAEVGEDKVLKLPFSNHGMGSGPARNWCWEHSITEGHKRHWLMDDNIYHFWRYHFNRRVRCNSGAIFKAAEDFVERFVNVPLSGLQYSFFYPDKCYKPPFTLNTRLMSCMLIENSCRHRWRGKYNEDVDLSIRILKDGDCTIMFNAFLQGKAATQTVKGGNTEEIYGGGTFEKSKMLVDLHPDCVKMARRYGRWHHDVDMARFKNNKLIFRDDFVLPEGQNEYGLTLLKNYGTDEQVSATADDIAKLKGKWN